MNYGAPSYIVQPAAVAQSGTRKVLIGVGICVCVTLFGVVVLGIALGVGLGVGLTRNKDSAALYSILAAPTVNCTYGGANTCGCSSVSPVFATPRIVQGYSAKENSWPWMVFLLMDANKTVCGGFLISYSHVITAAHCVDNVAANSIFVYAGLQKLSERNSAQVRLASSYIKHPSYSSSQFINDIAIITLSSAFASTSKAVGLCCLGSDTASPANGERGVITGWGKTSFTATTIPDELQQAVVQVQGDTSKCAASSTISTRFCAGYSGTDSCSGDSGGPFMTSSNNSWVCSGIVSSGSGCGNNGYYTRVSAYRDFIRTNTGV
jgi:trypsin